MMIVGFAFLMALGLPGWVTKQQDLFFAWGIPGQIVWAIGKTSMAVAGISACVLDNLPDIEDVRVSVETLRHLGATVDWDPSTGIKWYYRMTPEGDGVELFNAGACAVSPAPSGSP